MNKAYNAADNKFSTASSHFTYYLHGESLASYLDDSSISEDEIIFDDSNKEETKTVINSYKTMRHELTIMNDNNTGKYDYDNNKDLFDNCTIALHKTSSYDVLKRNNLLK